MNKKLTYELEMRYPKVPNHPGQKYKAKAKG